MIGSEAQVKAMTAVLEAAGANLLTVNGVGTVADNRRLFALSQMITAFLAELARRRGEICRCDLGGASDRG